MWNSTKPSSMMPLTAMTHFLPTAERQKRTSGLPGRDGRGIGDRCRSAGRVVDCVAVMVRGRHLLDPPLGSAARNLTVPGSPRSGGLPRNLALGLSGLDDPEPLEDVVVAVLDRPERRVAQRERDLAGAVVEVDAARRT